LLGLVGHGLERRAYIALELADMGGFTRLAERRTFSGLVDVGGEVLDVPQCWVAQSRRWNWWAYSYPT